MKPAPISVDPPSPAKDTAELSFHGQRSPQQIGPYKIIKLIGRGGMGSVYRAQVVVSCQVPIGQEVALKLLRETDTKERKRFAREALYLQALHHPGIVRVLDNGEYEGQPYIVMQLVEGKHADDLFATGTYIDQSLIADIGVQALEALHVAHMHGILHRDIKPSNIMIGANGQIKLVDFGLAQYMDAGESHLTQTGAVVGTPAYMSPEQASGRREEISRRSDVYSMGACLYELATGRQPFIADNSVAVLRCIIDDPLIPPSNYRADLARDLETIILKAMAKDARDRYPNAEAMAADLRRFRLGVRIKTARPHALIPFLRLAWQHRAALSLIALVVFVVTSATTLVVRTALKHAEKKDAENTEPINQVSALNNSVTGSATPPVNQTQLDDPWVEAFAQNFALDDPMSTLDIRDGSLLGPNMKRVRLPSVSGPVRLTTHIALSDHASAIELLVSDRDFAKGYRVRLSTTANQDRLELLRENRVVRSRDLGQLPRDRDIRLSLERVNDTITVQVDKKIIITYKDIVPLEGLLVDGVSIAYNPAHTKVLQVLLERQRSTLYVSALSVPDNLRQQSYFSRAIDEYENFIKDHPHAPEVRDAHYRIALCLERMNTPATDELALEKFNEFSSIYRNEDNNDNDIDYVLGATFHAWSIALRLGRIEEAEAYFEAIRRDYDLTVLLPTIPEDTVKDLVKDYLSRADQLAGQEPDRAIRLFIIGADIASYLNQPDAMAQAHIRAGDLLILQKRYGEALANYRTVMDDDAINEQTRMQFRLRSAQIERLRNRVDSAETLYQAILDHPVELGEIGRWARLWLGDLYVQKGDFISAYNCWGEGGETKTIPGQIMFHLLTSEKPLPLNKDQPHAHEIMYFNARLAFLRGQFDVYRSQLEMLSEEEPAYDWPVVMAKTLWGQLAAQE
jgi:serine/threonine protein kinase/tetratricopeptide (TPR) repeat protein